MKVRRKEPLYKLQPLRIPSSWEVTYNTLTEIDPESLKDKEDSRWMNFTEDLLQIKYTRQHIILDVGWYPEGDPFGCYGVELIENSDWINPMKSFETSNKADLVEEIEKLLWQVGEDYFVKP